VVWGNLQYSIAMPEFNLRTVCGRLASEGKMLPMIIYLLLSLGAVWGVWQVYAPILAAVYSFFILLLAVGSLIDIDQFIIPDTVTLGGTVLGLVASFFLPALMQQQTHIQGFLWSLLGATAGAAMLWTVVELGKRVFGKKSLIFPQSTNLHWVRFGDDADLQVGQDKLRWSDIFSRESDQLHVYLKSALQVDGKNYEQTQVTFFYNRLVLEGLTLKLEELNEISAVVDRVVIPREAMGFGDVKLIAAIGAFLGWEGVLFTVFSSSVIGFVAGLAGILVSRDRSKTILPYGPYLALGAMLWMVFREPIMLFYGNL
jgi:leader peptidase (prepilin peptidase)/N-methyltransferase